MSILHLPTRFPFFPTTTLGKVISSAQAVFKCQADRDHNTEAKLGGTLGTFLGDAAEQMGLPGLHLEESAGERTRRRLQLRHFFLVWARRERARPRGGWEPMLFRGFPAEQGRLCVWKICGYPCQNPWRVLVAGTRVSATMGGGKRWACPWCRRGCYSDVRLPRNGHLRVRSQGLGAWNYRPQRTGCDSRPPQLSQVRINGHLVLVSVSGPHTGV